jgi:hypothetical protein
MAMVRPFLRASSWRDLMKAVEDGFFVLRPETSGRVRMM